MKKLTLFISVLFSVNTLISQTASDGTTAKPMIDKQVKGVNVPQPVIAQFNKDYPGEQPTWSKSGEVYRATFVDGSKMFGHAVGYDKKGFMAYREDRVAEKDYPSAITDYHANKYPNDKYEVWVTTDNNNKRRYYSNHNLETHWFDENGKYVNTLRLRD